MAKELTARNAFAGIEETAEVMAPPGEMHHDIDAEHIVKQQHYLMGYYGRCNISQSWYNVAAGYGPTTTSTSLVRMLTYLIKPRLAMTGVTWNCYVSSAHGATVYVEIPGTAHNSTVAAAAGAQYITGSMAGINRANTLTQIDVKLKATAGAGPTATILSFSMVDTDLAAGTLP